MRQHAGGHVGLDKSRRRWERVYHSDMAALVRGALLLLPVLPGFLPERAAGQSPPDSAVYHVDPASRLVVKTGKAGLFGFAGHTHVIRARAISAELVYHPGKSTSYLRIKLPTDSLEVITPPDTAEIRKVTEAMRTEVLHVDRYPEMSFAADSLTVRSGSLKMQLAVTMEGTTRKVPVIADVRIGGDTLRASGSFTAKQTDFGIKPFKGGPAGTVKVADKVTFCFDLVATRRESPAPARLTSLRPDSANLVPGCIDRAGSNAGSTRRVM
jgi:polyisoprenoid-binding protein YceI